jgi:hypothetical protein
MRKTSTVARIENHWRRDWCIRRLFKARTCPGFPLFPRCSDRRFWSMNASERAFARACFPVGCCVMLTDQPRRRTGEYL